jgi:uncharacterized protein (TIGR02266 family)
MGQGESDRPPRQNSSQEDRREATRYEARVRCWLERESVTLLGTVTNISEHGLFLKTPVTISKGSAVKLSLDLGDVVVNAAGRVVWSRSANECASRVPGIGVRLDSTDTSSELIERFLRDQ